MAIYSTLRLRIFLFLFTLTYILRLISATCFAPDGTDRNTFPDATGGNRFQPYDTGNGYSMCCATSRSKFADDCRPDGLCHNQGASLVWRESCTDPTWQSPSCVKLCITGTNFAGQQANSPDEIITACPDRSFCCGTNNTDCSVKNLGVWIKDGKATDQRPTGTDSTTASSTATASASAQSAISSSATTSAQSSSKTSSGEIGGIVGGVVGAVLILVISVIWCLRRRRTISRHQMRTTSDNALIPVEKKPRELHELSEIQRDSELDGRPLVEVHGVSLSSPPKPLPHYDE